VRILITNWGLNTFMDHYHSRVFTKADYKNVIRPDTMLLAKYPHDPKFQLTQFWHQAKLRNGMAISDGYKMKWDNLGSGHNELRVLVAIIGSDAYICEGYQKVSPQAEQMKLLKFIGHIDLIRRKKVRVRGELK
jgi:hypothetical protein